MDDIGIGILCYYGLEDVRVAVRSVKKHTRLPYQLLIFDNSENFEVGQWAITHAADATYLRSPYNVGCAVSKNRMAEWFAARGMSYFIIMDQDVEVIEVGWAQKMREVFSKHPDTGIVGWSLANRTMGTKYPTDKTGRLPELPGMCNMYSLTAVKAVGGWCPEYFFFRFDSDFCLHCATMGYQTRVVLGPDMVRHNHPHQGVKRHPRHSAIRQESQKIFDRRKKELGFENCGI